MLEIVLLALSLAIDAFVVAIAVHAKKHDKKTALIMVALFGIFQALMPLIGYIGGLGLEKIIGNGTKLIAFVLLGYMGAKMIKNALQSQEDNEIPDNITLKTLFILSIATSIDALAAGLVLPYLPLSPFLSVAIIGFITAGLTFVGTHIGKHMGETLGTKAEIIGGLVLIGIGIKIVMV